MEFYFGGEAAKLLKRSNYYYFACVKFYSGYLEELPKKLLNMSSFDGGLKVDSGLSALFELIAKKSYYSFTASGFFCYSSKLSSFS